MEGGWKGILIVFSAFMIQVLAFGNYACIGVYTVHILDQFDNDTVGVSLISSIHFATLLCCGPLASFLMSKVSYRKVCLVGAALVCIGIFCTPLISSLPAMYVFFGIFAGFGGCLIYLPSHVMSGLYYDKYRSLSTGIATAGTGMGAIVMPLVVGMLIEEYSWKGSLTILAGLDLHLFIFALFMTPPPKQSDKIKAVSKPSLVHQNDIPITEYHAIPLAEDNVPSTYNELTPQLSSNKQTAQALSSRHSTRENDQVCNGRSAVAAEAYSQITESLLNSKKNPHIIPEDDISRLFIPSYLKWKNPSSEVLPHDHCHEVTETAVVTAEQAAQKDEDKDNKQIDIEIASLFSEPKTLKEILKGHLIVLYDFKFIVYLISTLVWGLTTTMFVTFGPEMIVLKGHSAINAAFVITFFGVGQLVGCLIMSVVANFLGKRLILYMIANFVTGIFLSVIPLFNSFSELAIMLVTMGIAWGGILGLYMIVTVDLVGVQDMDVGLGYVLLASGLGCFLGPPIGGYFGQIYGGYDEAFYIAGVVTVLGGGLVMVLMYLPGCWAKKSNKQEQTVQN